MIMWNYLDIPDIISCKLVAHKFSVFTFGQSAIFRHALRGIKWCINTGDLPAIKFMSRFDRNISRIKNHPSLDCFALCCRNGHIDLAKWLYETGNIDVSKNQWSAFTTAFNSGHFDITIWLYTIDNNCIENRTIPTSNIAYTFVKNGLEKYAHHILKICCINNHNNQLQIAQWIYTNILNGIVDNELVKVIFDIVCERGHINVFQWFFNTLNITTVIKNIWNDEYYVEYFRCNFNKCFANGHLELIKIFHKTILDNDII